MIISTECPNNGDLLHNKMVLIPLITTQSAVMAILVIKYPRRIKIS